MGNASTTTRLVEKPSGAQVRWRETLLDLTASVVADTLRAGSLDQLDPRFISAYGLGSIAYQAAVGKPYPVKPVGVTGDGSSQELTLSPTVYPVGKVAATAGVVYLMDAIFGGKGNLKSAIMYSAIAGGTSWATAEYLLGGGEWAGPY